MMNPEERGRALEGACDAVPKAAACCATGRVRMRHARIAACATLMLCGLIGPVLAADAPAAPNETPVKTGQAESVGTPSALKTPALAPAQGAVPALSERKQPSSSLAAPKLIQKENPMPSLGLCDGS